MGQAFPELMRSGQLITETLRQEEIRFKKTLARGLSILEEESAALKIPDQRHASFSQQDGSTAVELHTQKKSEGQRKVQKSTSAVLHDAMKEFYGGAE